MRRLSTRIGVYAILLITAFYGTFSVINSPAKTSASGVEVIQKEATSVQANEKAANSTYYLGKNDNGKLLHSVSLKSPLLAAATVNTTAKFFAYSATIQHYISTI